MGKKKLEDMIFSKRHIAPEFHRIPHFNSDISNMTHDDILLDNDIVFPLDCYYEEKIDGSNMGVSWQDGPILRNREHILKKGYSKIKTPAKKQFTSAWNWLHEHEDDIKKVEEIWQSKICIFGEWMFAKHSIYYDNLPDLFIAYDIWSVEDSKFLSPVVVGNLLSETSISFVKPAKANFKTIGEVVSASEGQSVYRDGIVEGIVIKTVSDDKGFFLDRTFKVVNNKFERREDFNKELIKNKCAK